MDRDIFNMKTNMAAVYMTTGQLKHVDKLKAWPGEPMWIQIERNSFLILLNTFSILENEFLILNLLK